MPERRNVIFMQALPGFRDFLPKECATRNYIFAHWREVARMSGFVEWDGPILEPTELYEKKSGSEIVTQLFNFVDKGGREVALRPELTPTLARVVAAHNHEFRKPFKWFSIGPYFRHERQQRGRLREHFQLNCDIVGEASLAADIELVALSIDILREFGFTEKDFVVRVSDREFWTEFLKSKDVPESRWQETLQVIDRSEREPREKTAEKLGKLADPVFVALNSGGKSEKLDKLVKGLGIRGLADFVEVDVGIVRGLAYYTGIVFELFDRAGKFRAIAGGGRYDNLICQLSDGAVSLPAVGFAMGDVVLAELIQTISAADNQMREAIRDNDAIDIYVSIAKETLRPLAIEYVQALRDAGYRVEYAFSGSKIRQHLRSAEQIGGRAAVVFGDEWPDVTVKVLATGEDKRMSAQESLRWLRVFNRGPRKLRLPKSLRRFNQPAMDVEILALCDAATAQLDGKLNLLGVFDQIRSLKVPTNPIPCSLATRIRFSKTEEGQKAIRIAIIDADGKPVFPTLDTNVDVRVPPNESSHAVQVILGIQQLSLPAYGEYAVDLAIDGRVEKSIPLLARPIKQQSQT